MLTFGLTFSGLPISSRPFFVHFGQSFSRLPTSGLPFSTPLHINMGIKKKVYVISNNVIAIKRLLLVKLNDSNCTLTYKVGQANITYKDII